MKLIFTVFMLLPLIGFSQSIKFTDVVEVDSSLKKDQLYTAAKEWFVHSFNSAKDVIQLDDKERGKLIGKGNFQYFGKAFVTGTNSTGVVHFTTTIEVKDGKYRYTFDNFRHEAYRNGSDIGEISEEPKGMMKAAKKSVRKDCEKEIEKTIADLKKAMTSPTTTDF